MKYFSKQLFLDFFWGNKRIVNDCWEWIGSTGAGRANNQPNGYGRIYYPISKKGEYVHRLAWELANNKPVPEDYVIMHTCDNTICYNPAHLKLGTHKENTRDSMTKGRWAITKGRVYGHRGHGPNKDLCPRGHKYTPENTYIYYKNGKPRYRQCKKCQHLAYVKRKNMLNFLHKGSQPD